MLNAADSTKNVNAGKSDEDCDIFQVGIISLKKVNFLKKGTNVNDEENDDIFQVGTISYDRQCHCSLTLLVCVSPKTGSLLFTLQSASNSQKSSKGQILSTTFPPFERYEI